MACASLGLSTTDDLNDPVAPLNICGKFDCTIDSRGHRSSTFLAFLPQSLASERKAHLHICTGATVLALDIEDPHGITTVKGVLYQAAENRDGRVYCAKARREVIMCAGAIATRQILLLRYVAFYAILST